MYIQLKKQRYKKRKVLEEAEEKLMKAMKQIELDGKSMSLESQIVKEKIYNFEQKKLIEKQKEDLIRDLYGSSKKRPSPKQRELQAKAGSPFKLPKQSVDEPLRKNSLLQSNDASALTEQLNRLVKNNSASAIPAPLSPKGSAMNTMNIVEEGKLGQAKRDLAEAGVDDDQNIRDRLINSLRSKGSTANNTQRALNPQKNSADDRDIDSLQNAIRRMSIDKQSNNSFEQTKRFSKDFGSSPRNEIVNVGLEGGPLAQHKRQVSGAFELQPASSRTHFSQKRGSVDQQSGPRDKTSSSSSVTDSYESQEVNAEGNKIVKVRVDLSASMSVDDERLVSMQKSEKFIYRRQKSVLDKRSYTDRYIDKFFRKRVKDKDLSVTEVDKEIHGLIHRMLLMGEDDPQMKHRVHLQTSMIHHQEMILAVKDAIKPGLFSIYFRRYTPHMVKEYFRGLKKKKRQIESKDRISKNKKDRMKRMLKKKLSADLELNINSINYVQGKTAEKHEEKIKTALIHQQVGPRASASQRVLLDMVRVQEEQEMIEKRKKMQRNMVADAVFSRQRSVINMEDEIEMMEIMENHSNDSQRLALQQLKEFNQQSRAYHSDLGRDDSLTNLPKTTTNSRIDDKVRSPRMGVSANVSIASGGTKLNIEAPAGLKSMMTSDFALQKNIHEDDDHLIMLRIQKNAHYKGTLAHKIDEDSIRVGRNTSLRNTRNKSNASSKNIVVSDSSQKELADQMKFLEAKANGQNASSGISMADLPSKGVTVLNKQRNKGKVQPVPQGATSARINGRSKPIEGHPIHMMSSGSSHNGSDPLRKPSPPASQNKQFSPVQPMTKGKTSKPSSIAPLTSRSGQGRTLAKAGLSFIKQ